MRLGVQVMTNLIGSGPGGFSSSHTTCGLRKPCANDPHNVQPQEPIHVHVRIRRYADPSSGSRQAPSSKPDLGLLPVGAALDCYM